MRDKSTAAAVAKLEGAGLAITAILAAKANAGDMSNTNDHFLGLRKLMNAIKFLESTDGTDSPRGSASATGKLEFAAAAAVYADRWVPAAGGTEVPTLTRDGRMFLYVYNPATGRHGWLNLSTDVVEDVSPY